MPKTKHITSPTPYASSGDFHRIFKEEKDSLYRLSFLLTADQEMAHRLTPVCSTSCFVELVIDNCATDRSLMPSEYCSRGNMAGTTGHGCTNSSSRVNNNNRVAARRVAEILHLAKTWFKPRRLPFYFAVRTGLPMSSFALPEMEGAHEYARSC
jgi:hypothetical protein